MTHVYCLGIDPGQSGGLAIVSHAGLFQADKMPETDGDLCDYLTRLQDNYRPFCYLELVHSMPGQGVSSTFRFGQNYGAIRMALIALKIPYETVTPQKWQAAMGCRSHGDKNITKAKAQELYPAYPRITHALADAILIATYGCRYSRAIRQMEAQ